MNLKCIYLFLILFLVLPLILRGQANTFVMPKLQGGPEPKPEAIPLFVPPDMPAHLVRYYAFEGRAGDSAGVSEWGGRGTEFGVYVTKNWSNMLKLWGREKPSSNIVGLVIFSAEEHFSSSEWVRFADQLLDCYKSGFVDAFAAQCVMAPTARMCGFMNANFRHSDVRLLIKKYRAFLPIEDRKFIQEWCDEILSGELEHQMEDIIGENFAIQRLSTNEFPLSWASRLNSTPDKRATSKHAGNEALNKDDSSLPTGEFGAWGGWLFLVGGGIGLLALIWRIQRRGVR